MMSFEDRTAQIVKLLLTFQTQVALAVTVAIMMSLVSESGWIHNGDKSPLDRASASRG